MGQRKGEGKLEFYLALEEIRTEYQNGNIVLNLLYEKLQKKYHWEMKAWTFRKYFRLEFQSDNTKEIVPKTNIEAIPTTNTSSSHMESSKPKSKVTMTPEMEKMMKDMDHLIPNKYRKGKTNENN